MEPVALSFSAALLLGLLYGAGPCNIACLPYLGPVFLARPGGIGGAWRTIVPFSAGRMAAYGALGAAAGALGRAVTAPLEEGTAPMVLGAASITVGLLIVWRARSGRPASCVPASTDASAESAVTFRETDEAATPLMPVGLFGMGAAMALNPCVPLGTVALAAAATARPEAGLMLGLGFGVGAVAIPAVMFGLVVAHVGAQVRSYLHRWKRGLERAAGGILIVMGLLTASGAFHP